jgi:hypothetical protein
MDIETCVRLLIGMSILRLRDYNDILMKAEKIINKNMGNLDAYQTYYIIYSFSKFNDGKAEG